MARPSAEANCVHTCDYLSLQLHRGGCVQPASERDEDSRRKCSVTCCLLCVLRRGALKLKSELHAWS